MSEADVPRARSPRAMKFVAFACDHTAPREPADEVRDHLLALDESRIWTLEEAAS